MKMVLEIPDELSADLARGLANPARAALEARAAAAYGRGGAVPGASAATA